MEGPLAALQSRGSDGDGDPRLLVLSWFGL